MTARDPLASWVALKAARHAAHRAFDPLWRSRLLPRTEAYQRLAVKLRLTPDECHMSRMSLATALRVPEAAREIRAEVHAERANGIARRRRTKTPWKWHGPRGVKIAEFRRSLPIIRTMEAAE